MTFKEEIIQGIPDTLPEPKPYDPKVNHAPKRKSILTPEEEQLALRNALRYFPAKDHKILLAEFKQELKDHGRIYMYRLRPDHKIYARPIDQYPGQSQQAKAIMLMIQNNLDHAVAQHPHELITYGGNGAVFQNWAQYRLTMQYLSQMNDDQTLVMYSGHPMGLFPSGPHAPRVVVTNGMMIPNYSKPDHWERFNALGVSQYGQMTAGSYMYIGPARHCAWDDHYGFECLQKIRQIPAARFICHLRIGGHERRPTQGRKYCRLCYRMCRSEQKSYRHASQPGLGGRSLR